MSFVKHDQEKTKYYMLEPMFIKGVADVLTLGARKYSPDNWKHYKPTKERPESATMCYYSALMRHVEEWRYGDMNDKETGKHHLLHATCCLMFMWWFDVTGRR